MSDSTTKRENGQPLTVGTYVIDRESDDEDSDLAVVVGRPDATCAERIVPGTGQTVAEFNEGYAADARVAVVAFVPALNALGCWQTFSPAELREAVAERDIQTYSYPVPRLEPQGTALVRLNPPEEPPVVVHFDGACNPTNPGGHGTYGVVVEQDGDVVHEDAGYLGQSKHMSNNVAEYEALIKALRYVDDHHGEAEITVRGDSQLVIRQMSGQYTVRSGHLLPLWETARELADGLDISFEWVGRDENVHADRLASEAYREAVEQTDENHQQDRPDERDQHANTA